jgi:hypothetical protein
LYRQDTLFVDEKLNVDRRIDLEHIEGINRAIKPLDDEAIELHAVFEPAFSVLLLVYANKSRVANNSESEGLTPG